MLDFVKIYLPSNDVGQIIDGLTQRMLVWRATAEYFETGSPQSADYIEECSDEHEATAIANHYQYIIEQIKRQRDEQQKTQPTLFLRLFHGRKEPNQDMDDWGFDGPIFGPYIGIHGVYRNNINLSKRNGDIDMLYVANDLVYYDGSYYGDWCILTEPATIDITTIFQQQKADRSNTIKPEDDPN